MSFSDPFDPIGLAEDIAWWERGEYHRSRRRRSSWESKTKRLRRKILVALLDAGDEGLTNVELAEIYYKFRARISELRDKGIRVKATPEGRGIYRYRILNPDFARQKLREGDF